ncbi:MAG: hypothetical protein J6S31_07190, partial [Lachnospiraceae bacterium]|nr:hypothetical protein [Lachnospiraceae bacterium]
MRKKLAKWIGSLILISMILTSVCPLSVLAADESAPSAETTVITETETPQETPRETPQETPVKTTEPQVTEVPVAGDTADNQTVTGKPDSEKGTDTVLNGSEEGIVAGGEKAANPDEKKDESENASDNPDEKKEDADGTGSQDADKKESLLDENKEEESDSSKEAKVTLAAEPAKGESASDEKKDNLPAEALFDNSTDVADGTYLPDDVNVTIVNPKDKNENDNFKIQQITVKNGKATATVYSVSEKMTHIYVGNNADISAAEEDLVDGSGNLVTNVYAITGQLVEIPVKLNGGSVAIKTRTTAMSSPRWTNNSYTITITEPEEPSEEPFDNSTDVADGTYLPDDVNVTIVNPKDKNENDNFKIQQITVKNGK